jgi:hypothetical protein
MFLETESTSTEERSGFSSSSKKIFAPQPVLSLSKGVLRG